jgi:chromosome segregation ATPase
MMSLEIHFFRNNVDFQKTRKNIDTLQEKLRSIQDKIEQLEDDYEDAKLSAFNITHNFNEMAKAVGLYEVLWHSEEIAITVVSQMILPLEKGIKELELNPDKDKAYNPPNGWGSYEDFVRFCKSVLQTCHGCSYRPRRLHQNAKLLEVSQSQTEKRE